MGKTGNAFSSVVAGEETKKQRKCRSTLEERRLNDNNKSF